MKSKILIVEDEQIVVLNFKRLLGSFGYDVVDVASTGEDALMKVSDNKPDLVLMDINLKGNMDGIEAAAKIYDEFDIPVVYLTAHSEERTIERAKHTLPYGYILKPVNDAQLKNTIKLALHKHRLESKLKESERKYRTIFENTGTATVIVDHDMNILEINSAGEKSSGYNKDEIIGKKKWTEFVPSREYEKLENIYNEMKKDPNSIPRQVETKLKDRCGNIIDVLVTIGNIPNTKKNSLSILDITNRKKSEYQLKKSEEVFRGVVEQANEGIVICDEQGIITQWNHAQEIITGIKYSKVIGQPVWEIAFQITQKKDQTREAYDIIKIIFLKLLKSGKIEDSFKRQGYKIILPDGSYRFLNISIFTIKTEKGFMISSIITDITEQKEAEVKIRNSLKEKDLLIKEIHHRVKNNLQIIYSLLNLQESFIEKNPTAIKVLKESQNRVLSMSMIYEMIYQSKDLSRINFSDYINNLVIQLFNSYGVNNNITTVLDLENFYPNIETSIPLGLIISELVSNSLKYAFPNKKTGEVTISLNSHNDGYKLTISDNGIGLPENIDFTNSEAGLGLKLVNSLVQQLDGSINLDRSQRAKFTINFKELNYKERI